MPAPRSLPTLTPPMVDPTPFNGATLLDIEPRKVLEAALSANLSSVVLVGKQDDGTLYIAASMAEAGEMLWLTDRVRWHLHRSYDAANE